jgi:uncharacterized membrane protein (UPF0136 family)
MKRFSNIMLFYGIVLVICGVAGFLTNPEHAVPALISGVMPGVAAMSLSFLIRQKSGWALPASMGATGVFAMMYGRQALRSWEFATSPKGNLVILILCSVMAVASVITLILLVTANKAKANSN